LCFFLAGLWLLDLVTEPAEVLASPATAGLVYVVQKYNGLAMLFQISFMTLNKDEKTSRRQRS
jgi:hypothetical protein